MVSTGNACYLGTAYEPARNVRRSSEALLAQWIRPAWNDISSESTVTGFKMCCVSNNISGKKKIMSCGRRS
jgi:hypothetical protein